MLNEKDFFISASGVVLSRKSFSENNLCINLFLKGNGILAVKAPGGASARPRFGGDTEPFVWGSFHLRKVQKGTSFIIDSIDAVDDMLPLRQKPKALLTVVNWSKKIIQYMPLNQADDALLANFYWNMKLLSDSQAPVDAVNWRFLWRWLEFWGLAPDIIEFYSSKKFNSDEIRLLIQTAKLETKNIPKLFSEELGPYIRQNIFQAAFNCSVGFLNEK